MNRSLSVIALVFFSVALLLSVFSEVDIIGIMNVGLMFLSMAAIEGRGK